MLFTRCLSHIGAYEMVFALRLSHVLQFASERMQDGQEFAGRSRFGRAVNDFFGVGWLFFSRQCASIVAHRSSALCDWLSCLDMLRDFWGVNRQRRKFVFLTAAATTKGTHGTQNNSDGNEKDASTTNHSCNEPNFCFAAVVFNTTTNLFIS